MRREWGGEEGERRRLERRAVCGRRARQPRKVDTPDGSRSMRTVASGLEPRRGVQGSRQRAVWDACILQRSGMPARDTAARAGMPDLTTRRRLVDMNKNRRERIAYDDERCISRGRYYAFDVGEGTALGGPDEENRGKRGRPFACGGGLFVAAWICMRSQGSGTGGSRGRPGPGRRQVPGAVVLRVPEEDQLDRGRRGRR